MTRWSLVLGGFFFMLCGAYFDNLRGPLLPHFGTLYGISYSQAGLVLVAGNFASVLFTFLLIPLTQHFEEKKVALWIAAGSVVCAVSSFGVSSFFQLVLWGVGLGGSVAALGAMSNLLVIRGTSLTQRASMFCGLHTLFGVGSALGAFSVGRLLSYGVYWAWVPLLGVLALAGSGVALSQVKRLGHESVSREPTVLSGIQKFAMGTFCFYVAGEVVTSMWMTTYLVETRGLNVGEASPYVSGFFLVMAVTRILSFLWVRPGSEVRLILGSLVVSMFFLILGLRGYIWALPMAGFLGPFFPLFLARLSRVFPAQAKTLTLWVLTLVQLTLALFHLVIGRVSDALGMGLAYYLPAVLLGLSLVGTVFYLRIENRGFSTAI